MIIKKELKNIHQLFLINLLFVTLSKLEVKPKLIEDIISY